MIHAEVVLQRDGGKGLRGSLHLHVLLGLYGLVQAIAPAAAFHDAACLLIDDLHFAVDDDVFLVEVEHRVGLQQLLYGVHALALDGVVGVHLVFLLHALLVGEALVALEGRELCGNVGQDEEVVVVHFAREPGVALVGEVGAVELLVDDEVERLYGLGHTAVVVLHVDLLGGEHAALDAGLGEIFDEGLVLGQGLVGAEEREEAGFGLLLVLLSLTFGDELLGLGQILCGQLALHAYEFLHQRLVFLEHLVVALGHGTADDEGRAGIVDEHRVDLVDDGVVVHALHEVLGRGGHVVAQVVEAELVVRAEGDVGLISTAACLGVGLVLVDAVDREAVEHIERAHPFRVALGQIVVDGDYVHAVASEGVEEYGQGSHEGLTLTRSHLGNLALVEHGAAEELHVVVDHVPHRLVAAGDPMVVVDGAVAVDVDEVVAGGQLAVEVGGGDDDVLVVGEAFGGRFHDGEGHGTNLVEHFLEHFKLLFLELVDFLEDRLAVLDGRLFNLCLQLVDLSANGHSGLAYARL